MDQKPMARIVGLLAAGLLLSACAAGTVEEGRRQPVEQGHWQPVENQPNCVVWNRQPQPYRAVTWDGPCPGGKAQGLGELVWRFRKFGQWTKDTYSGWMKAGKRYGHGVLLEASGAKYEGGWKDDELHGRGVFVSASGDRYAGNWKGGKWDGAASW